MQRGIFTLLLSLAILIILPQCHALAGNSEPQLPENRDMVLDLEEDPASCIVAQSGSMVIFDFTVTCMLEDDTVDIWFDLGLPDGQEIGPYYMWWSVPITAGSTAYKHCLLYISPMCMPGVYTVYGRCGTHCTGQIEDEDSFTFEKLTGQLGNAMPGKVTQVPKAFSHSQGLIVTDGSSEPVMDLLGVFPQPCNPELNVEFSLAEQGQLEVSLFNLQGRRVLKHTITAAEPGDHSLILPTAEIPSGVYFLRLNANGTSIQRTVTIMK